MSPFVKKMITILLVKGDNMPIPSPKPKEEMDKYMTRCMSDEVMKKEFPQNKQRVAVCMSNFKRSNKKSAKTLDKK